jgi:RHS repeat-associated protein
LNRLEKATNNDGQTSLYRYNGLGQRVGKQVNDGLNPTQDISYVLDLTKQYHNLLQTDDGGQVKSYLWDFNVVSESGGDGERFYMQDELGSPLRFVGTDGELVDSYSYDEFGNDITGNQGLVQPFGYTGYRYDSLAGTYFAQAREYNSLTSRMSSPDLHKGDVVSPQSLNPYLYVENNPIRYVDPDGCKKIETRVTYTTYKREYGYGGKGTGYRMVVDQIYEMTKVEFTNLNLIVYTMDGSYFHTLQCALIDGEYQSLNDPTSLIPIWSDDWMHSSTYRTLSMVEKMDKTQGNRIVRNSVTTTISVASEFAGIYGFFANGIVVIADYTGQAITGELKTPEDALLMASGIIPYWGSVSGAYDTYQSFDYQPSLSPFVPHQPKPTVQGGTEPWQNQTRPSPGRIPGGPN